MPEVTFTRSNACQHGTYLSHAHAPGWAVDVWRDKRKQPITVYRHADNYSVTMALELDSATARALANELLHATDVAELAAKTTPGE